MIIASLGAFDPGGFKPQTEMRPDGGGGYTAVPPPPHTGGYGGGGGSGGGSVGPSQPRPSFPGTIVSGGQFSVYPSTMAPAPPPYPPTPPSPGSVIGPNTIPPSPPPTPGSANTPTVTMVPPNGNGVMVSPSPPFQPLSTTGKLFILGMLGVVGIIGYTAWKKRKG